MIYVIFSICLLYFTKSHAEEICPIKFCNGTYHHSSVVEDFCREKEGHMNESCCIVNETVIGLDFRSCEIELLNITGFKFTDLLIMDLTDNELQKLTTEDLNGLVHLDQLYLPLKVPCPGGKKAWNQTIPDPPQNRTLCFIQVNPCYELKINCTENGDCIHTGPGSAKCICKPGHYGYKCLNEGEFSIKYFSASVAVAAIVLSILLWFGIGRDVYKAT